MRDVFVAAFEIHSKDLLMDLDFDDYKTLFRSAEPALVTESVKNNYFVLGVLVSLILYKVHAPPPHITPALLQYAIGGIESVLGDRTWLTSISSTLNNVWDVVPDNPRRPIDTNNDILLQVIRIMLNGTRMDVSIFFVYLKDHI